MRALASLVGGVSVLITTTLFPEALRDTTTYRVFVGNFERFIVEKIAQIQRDPPIEISILDVTDDYLQRKVIGSALEAAGLLTLHISPVWVFAIAGDVVGGSNLFLKRLTTQLKSNGVIAETTQVSELTDLLEAMQQATGKSARLVDTPPLSRQDLALFADELRTSYHQIFAKTTNLLPRMETIWRSMRSLSLREQISFSGLAGMMTLSLANAAEKGVTTAFTVGSVSGELFGEKILESYVVTLDKIISEGGDAYLDHHLGPFIEAAVGHFNPGKKSWTESLFSVSIPPELKGKVRPSMPLNPTNTNHPILTLVALHGNGGGGFRFDRIKPYLPPEIQFQAVTLPGFAGEPPEPALRTLQDYANKLRVMIAGEARPVVLLGHGIGGSIALEFVQHHAAEVDALILHAPVGTQLETRRFPRLMASPIVCQFGQWLFSSAIARPVFRRLLFSKPVPSRYLDRFFNEYRQCTVF